LPVNAFRGADITQVGVIIELDQAPLGLCPPVYIKHAFVPVRYGGVVSDDWELSPYSQAKEIEKSCLIWI